jgi:hypothetical protein
MEDFVSGTFDNSSASGTPVAMISTVLEDGDSPRTPSSINAKRAETTRAKKPSVNQSVVREHFKKIDTVDKENSKAMCKYCNRLIGCHHRKQGTSPMMTHLTSNCLNSPLRKSNLGKNQTLLTFKKRMDGDQSTSPSPLRYVKYDVDHSRHLLCRYLILYELLFSHVEHEGFKEFSI